MPAQTMSQLENVSAILGEYMLKGWTLTDLHCDQCRSTPLMREPVAAAQRESRERIQFCASCDGRPEFASAPARSAAVPQTSSATAPPKSENKPAENPAPSGPDAAESISTLLLKGYSLLADNCPNTACRGIPLVGYPRKPDGSKDGRRMCVSCEGRWIDEKNVPSDWATSGPAPGSVSQQRESESGATPESPRTKRRRELYGLSVTGTNTKKELKGLGKQVDMGDFEKRARESENELVGKSREEAASEKKDSVQPSPSQETPRHPIGLPNPFSRAVPPDADSPIYQSLASTSSALSETLSALSWSLEQRTGQNTVSAGEEGKWFVDIKLHTEAMKDVLGVLGQVERAKRQGW